MANTKQSRSRIFLSYRHEDTDVAVGRLADDLCKHFASEQVFQDFASIEPGTDFTEVVQHGLDTCAAVLVVIGPRWLTVADRQGRRRLSLPDDWVAHEVAESLKRPEVRVFPLLVDADMPSADELPESLRPLTRRQAFPLTSRHWPNDVAQLITFLKKVPGLAAMAAPAAETSQAQPMVGAAELPPKAVVPHRPPLESWPQPRAPKAGKPQDRSEQTDETGAQEVEQPEPRPVRQKTIHPMVAGVIWGSIIVAIEGAVVGTVVRDETGDFKYTTWGLMNGAVVGLLVGAIVGLVAVAIGSPISKPRTSVSWSVIVGIVGGLVLGQIGGPVVFGAGGWLPMTMAAAFVGVIAGGIVGAIRWLARPAK